MPLRPLPLIIGLTLLGGVVAAPAASTGVDGGAAVAGRAVPTVVTYSAPVPEPLDVVRGFVAPVNPYGPGHRGVDLAVRSGQVVRSAGTGVVTFAGSVAGRGLVVVHHLDGVSTEYEPIRPLVVTGAAVAAGTAIGRLVGSDPECGRAHCLHWGARRDGQYIDPLSLLQPLGAVRLLPWPVDR